MKLKSNNIKIIEKKCDYFVNPLESGNDQQIKIFDSFLLYSEFQLSGIVNLISKKVKSKY